MYVHLQISIEDNGLGISEAGQKNLFIDFGKLTENGDRNKSGTGLGLSICKKIIEQMGGNVEVESKVGVGSKFIINIKTKCKYVKAKVNDIVNDSEPASPKKSFNNFMSFSAAHLVNTNYEFVKLNNNNELELAVILEKLNIEDLEI